MSGANSVHQLRILKKYLGKSMIDCHNLCRKMLTIRRFEERLLNYIHWEIYLEPPTLV